MQKKSFSWGLIILMLFLFFPVAIFMIIRKMSVETFCYAKNGKSLRIMGIVLLSIGAFYFLSNLTGSSVDAGSLVACLLLFGGGGALCIWKGNAYIKRGARYSRYISIIQSGNDLLVDNIAAAVPTTYEQAVVDIQAMLDAGYFANAYLDIGRRELMMPRVQTPLSVAAANVSPAPAAAEANMQPHSVKCESCGALNRVVPGVKSECEYCGSPLS